MSRWWKSGRSESDGADAIGAGDVKSEHRRYQADLKAGKVQAAFEAQPKAKSKATKDTICHNCGGRDHLAHDFRKPRKKGAKLTHWTKKK